MTLNRNYLSSRFLRFGSHLKIFFPPQSPFLFYKKSLKEGWKISWFVGLCVLLNLKQVHVGKNVTVVVGESANLSLADRYLL